MRMSTVIVEFNIGKTKIKTEATTPQGKINNEEGNRVMIINNAIQNIKKDLGIDLHKKENIHDLATVLYN